MTNSISFTILIKFLWSEFSSLIGFQGFDFIVTFFSIIAFKNLNWLYKVNPNFSIKLSMRSKKYLLLPYVSKLISSYPLVCSSWIRMVVFNMASFWKALLSIIAKKACFIQLIGMVDWRHPFHHFLFSHGLECFKI